MTPEREAAQELFDTLATEFLGKPEIGIGPMFSSQGLTVRGKIFAFIGREGRLIVKLPADEAAALIRDGDAFRLTMGGRTMREWIGFDPPTDPATWADRMRASHDYVLSLLEEQR